MRQALTCRWLAPAVVAVVLAHAALAQDLGPEHSDELVGFDGVTDVVVRDFASDGCWPEPQVTKDLAIARLEAAGLYGGEPYPLVPDLAMSEPEKGVMVHEFTLDADTLEAVEAWRKRNLVLLVHAFDPGLKASGKPVPICVAYITVMLRGGDMRAHHLAAFPKRDRAHSVKEFLLSLVDKFTADWVESNK